MANPGLDPAGRRRSGHRPQRARSGRSRFVALPGGLIGHLVQLGVPGLLGAFVYSGWCAVLAWPKFRCWRRNCANASGYNLVF